MECEVCGHLFDPISTRWLCPACKTKHNCCEGAPLSLACPQERRHDDERPEPARSLADDLR